MREERGGEDKGHLSSFLLRLLSAASSSHFQDRSGYMAFLRSSNQQAATTAAPFFSLTHSPFPYPDLPVGATRTHTHTLLSSSFSSRQQRRALSPGSSSIAFPPSLVGRDPYKDAHFLQSPPPPPPRLLPSSFFFSFAHEGGLLSPLLLLFPFLFLLLPLFSFRSVGILARWLVDSICLLFFLPQCTYIRKIVCMLFAFLPPPFSLLSLCLSFSPFFSHLLPPPCNRMGGAERRK